MGVSAWRAFFLGYVFFGGEAGVGRSSLVFKRRSTEKSSGGALLGIFFDLALKGDLKLRT